MAYNISEEELLRQLIIDPSYCLFYHREKVKRMLPSLAKAYILVSEIQKELSERKYGIIYPEEKEGESGYDDQGLDPIR